MPPERGICSDLEHFLTRLRAVLLERAITVGEIDSKELALYSALAQQCFINEYVFAQNDTETQQAAQLHEMLSQKLAADADISPALLAVPNAVSLLHRQWPDDVTVLLRQQVREPLEELRDRDAIPSLTTIEGVVSLEVQRQYEENPYPRWTTIPPVTVQTPPNSERAADILVAGCGTGKHVIDTALLYPKARILAVDISRGSLACARRKTREAGLSNIDYAQADILKLGAIDRDFDRIEAVGVLHHLADPQAGWRALLARLRPGGMMRVGLYSKIARSAVVEGRALIDRHRFPATTEGIRACRPEIYRSDNGALAKSLTTLRDFFGTTGCRDLLFNVMEHRFALPEIKSFLAGNGLTFQGFELPPEVLSGSSSADIRMLRH